MVTDEVNATDPRPWFSEPDVGVREQETAALPGSRANRSCRYRGGGTWSSGVPPARVVAFAAGALALLLLVLAVFGVFSGNGSSPSSSSRAGAQRPAGFVVVDEKSVGFAGLTSGRHPQARLERRAGEAAAVGACLRRPFTRPGRRRVRVGDRARARGVPALGRADRRRRLRRSDKDRTPARAQLWLTGAAPAFVLMRQAIIKVEAVRGGDSSRSGRRVRRRRRSRTAGRVASCIERRSTTFVEGARGQAPAGAAGLVMVQRRAVRRGPKEKRVARIEVALADSRHRGRPGTTPSTPAGPEPYEASAEDRAAAARRVAGDVGRELASEADASEQSRAALEQLLGG